MIERIKFGLRACPGIFVFGTPDGTEYSQDFP